MSTAAGTLVIFDCDGVLVDSERLVIDIDVAAVTAAGWPMTREQAIEAFVGRSNADVMAMIEAQVGHPLPSDWDAAWEADYRRVFDELLEPVPGVRAAVEQVVARGRRTCVASSGSHDKMRRTLGPHRPGGAVRGSHLQRHRGRAWQARARPVPARRVEDAGRPRPLRRRGGQPVRRRRGPLRGHAGRRLRRRHHPGAPSGLRRRGDHRHGRTARDARRPAP